MTLLVNYSEAMESYCSSPHPLLCPTYKHYIASGEPGYDGSVCRGCNWWHRHEEKLDDPGRDSNFGLVDFTA